MKRASLPFLMIPCLLSACGADPVEMASEQTEEIVPESLVPSPPESDPAVEEAILAASPDYTRQMIDAGGGQKARYLYARADLNDDDRDEVFVYMLGSYFCGTGGCSLFVFTEAEEGYRVVNSFATSRIPVVVIADKSLGWRNLVRQVSGGGMPAEYVLHEFDGEAYVEKERLSADRAPQGEAYLAGDFTFESGLLLEPQD